MASGITVEALAARIDELTSPVSKLEKALADSDQASQLQCQAIASKVQEISDTLDGFNLTTIDPGEVEWVPAGFVAKVEEALEKLNELSEWAANPSTGFNHIGPGVAAQLVRMLGKS